MIMILLPVSVFSQPERTPYQLELFGSTAFYVGYRSIELYPDREPVGETDRFAMPGNERIAVDGELEMIDGLFRCCRESTPPYQTFEVPPPLLSNAEHVDTHRNYLFDLSYTDRNLRYSGDVAEDPLSRYDLWMQVYPFTPESRLENTLYPGNRSLRHLQETDNQPDNNLSSLINDFSVPPAGPTAQEAYYIPYTYPFEKERVSHSLYQDSKQEGDVNVKLPLYIPRLRGKNDLYGFLPDDIYIGTDIKYFNVSESLQSMKSGDATLSSEFNRLGSEWLETRSGQIYFEWRFGK